MSDIIELYKNGKVTVRRGIVTATVDPRKNGMERWKVVVRPPGRFNPRVGLEGYRVYYGPFEDHGAVNPKTITEQDAWLFDGHPAPATTEDKLAMARKMLDWHFAQEARKP